jgi:curli biogenesis system outer membrane secretion channel CsgG
MQRKVLPFGLFVLALLVFPPLLSGKEPPVIAVVAFENHTRVYIPDVENMGLQYLESALLSTGQFTLADRLTVDRSLTEIGFSSASGLVDPAYSIQLGKMLGAKYLVAGNVIDISCKTTEFRGYGVTTHRSFVSVTLGLRVVDAERGMVFFIDQVTLSRENLPFEFTSVRISGESRTTLQNLMQEGVRRLVGRFSQKMTQLVSQAAPPARTVRVFIDSIPPGADVEIGGIFFGNTPCELFLEEGKVLEITVSLAGYDSWTKKVLIRPDLKITATLRETPRTAPGQTQVQVQVGIDSQ